MNRRRAVAKGKIQQRDKVLFLHSSGIDLLFFASVDGFVEHTKIHGEFRKIDLRDAVFMAEGQTGGISADDIYLLIPFPVDGLDLFQISVEFFCVSETYSHGKENREFENIHNNKTHK